MKSYIYAAMMFLALSNHAHAALYTATPQSFNGIVGKLKDGDTVNLTGGQYGPLILSNSLCQSVAGRSCPVPKNLTFMAQPNTGTVNMPYVYASYVTGLTLSGLHISAPLNAQPHFLYAIDMIHLSGASILNCDISDQTQDVLKLAKGVEVRDSNNIRIQGNVFHNLLVAINLFTTPTPVPRANLTTGITVTGNEFVRIRRDGFNIAGVDNAVISGNFFHDFTPVALSVNGTAIKDHSDYIQFFSNSGDPSNRVQRISSNITINDNIMIRGLPSPMPCKATHTVRVRKVFLCAHTANQPSRITRILPFRITLYLKAMVVMALHWMASIQQRSKTIHW